jgi:GTP-binding protein EngB required for normal cell division
MYRVWIETGLLGSVLPEVRSRSASEHISDIPVVEGERKRPYPRVIRRGVVMAVCIVPRTAVVDVRTSLYFSGGRTMTEQRQLDFESLTEFKTELHACLSGFLEAFDRAGTGTKSSLFWPRVTALAERVGHCLITLEEHWQFLSIHQGQYIVALVGTVNAGKSSLGNVLLGDDTAFPEAPVRETTSPTEARLNETMLLVDLPGLGSVLATEDDRIVQDIARRADLLLLIMNVSESISGHLYSFLQQWTCRQACEQQLIVVLNKVDALGDLPDAFLRREIERFSRFLLHGDQSLGFQGIAELFDYELSVVPFSVRDHRAGRGGPQLQLLLDHIEAVRVNTGEAIPCRARRELAWQIEILQPIIALWQEISARVRVEDERIEGQAERVATELLELLGRAESRDTEAFESIWTSYRQQLEQAERPNFIQSVAKNDSPEFQRKRKKMEDLRNRYAHKYAESFDNCMSQLQEDISLAVSAHLGLKKRLQLPDEEAVGKAIWGLFYALWDHYDDVYFLDKQLTEASLQAAVEEARQAQATELDAWSDALEIALKAVMQSAVDASRGKLNPERQIIKILQSTVDLTLWIGQQIGSL